MIEKIIIIVGLIDLAAIFFCLWKIVDAVFKGWENET